VSTKTVTVTASNAVTKTVTVDAGATSSATNNGGSKAGNNNNGGNNGGNNNGGNNNGGNNNGGNNNGGNNNGGNNNNNNNSGNNKDGSNTGTNNGKNNGGTNNVGNSNSGSKNSSTSTGTGTSNSSGNNNPQTSLQLDPSVIGSNIARDGLGNGTEAGQAPSQTSTNNFINSCIGKTITNGLQVAAGSCNPIPMGNIPSKSNMVQCKFSSPPNFATIAANTPFKISLSITGLETGAFVNPNTNYFAAPQQVNSQGVIIGHSHFVIQNIKSLQDTSVPDPSTFALFQGLNAPAQNNELSITVAKGLPEGTYRMASINTAANHQPALVPVAQHGSMDDVIYFTVSANGAAASSSNSAGGGAGAAGQRNNTTSASSISSGKNSASSTSAANAKTTSIVNSSSTALSSSAAKATSTITNGTASTKGSSTKGGRKARRFASSRIA